MLKAALYNLYKKILNNVHIKTTFTVVYKFGRFPKRATN